MNGSQPKISRDVILDVKDLSIGFIDDEGQTTAITDKVSFSLNRAEILGIAGESGCGKTVTALALLRLLPLPAGIILSGSIHYNGINMLKADQQTVQRLRGNDISMIFQEPSAAMNPLMTIRSQLIELFDYHEYSLNPLSRINELLERVGFSDPGRILKSYPHELSGGMLQRVMIALALLLKPDIVIADEPTTALDATVQAQIMEILLQLQKEEGSSVILITHNLGLVAQYADRIAIMYAGRIVENAPVTEFLKNPLHPYSQGLIKAMPGSIAVFGKKRLIPIPGQVPRPADFPDGCRFQDRCEKAFEPCHSRPATSAPTIDKNHFVDCFLYEQT